MLFKICNIKLIKNTPAAFRIHNLNDNRAFAKPANYVSLWQRVYVKYSVLHVPERPKTSDTERHLIPRKRSSLRV